MGRRGRPPKSEHLRLIETGSYGRGRVSHRPTRREVKPTLWTGTEPPEYLKLDRRAKAAWRRLAPILQGVRLLTEADLWLLGMACQAFSNWSKATSSSSKSASRCSPSAAPPATGVSSASSTSALSRSG